MKNIGKLLQRAEQYATLAEQALSKVAAEHIKDQGLKRISDPRLFDIALQDIENKLVAIRNMPEVFSKIPNESAWTLSTIGGLKAVVQKIFGEGGLRLVFKTFLEENMGTDYPDIKGSKIQGSLEDFVKQHLTSEKRKAIKALEKLLDKKLPITVDQLKSQSSPEYWAKLSGFIRQLRGNSITAQSVQTYKSYLENELAKLIGSLPK